MAIPLTLWKDAGSRGIKQQALLVRYHPCVSGIGNYCLFDAVQNKLI